MLIVAILLASFSLVSSVKEMPMGHNEPLGNQRKSEGHIDIIDEMPSPKEFWKKYCSIGKPVLLRGFAKQMPAYERWTDGYLREKYGDLMVKLESKYEKDFKPEGILGMGQDTIRNFIDTYIEQDKYIVSQLPDPLSTEVLVPPCVLCGSFRSRLLEANIWLSSGNTKSLLHRDADNAINCLLNGTKDWILIDPKHENLLPIAVEPGSPYGGFTLINVNKVDLKKFPKMKKVPWYYANVTAGDCLFLPKGHWHQVRSYGNKNLAVSMLLARLKDYENTDCPQKGLPKAELLSDLPMVWTYDGFGAQTMGNTDPFELNETINWQCDEAGKITLESYEEELIGGLEINEDAHKGTVDIREEGFETPQANMIVMKKRAAAIMKILDPKNGRLFDCKDRSILTVENLKKIADIQDPDPANTKEYEFLHFDYKMVQQMIISSMEMNKETFIKKYRSEEGSKAGAEWVLSVLDGNQDGRITSREVSMNMDTVLEKYKEDMLKDLSHGQVRLNSREIKGGDEDERNVDREEEELEDILKDEL